MAYPPAESDLPRDSDPPDEQNLPDEPAPPRNVYPPGVVMNQPRVEDSPARVQTLEATTGHGGADTVISSDDIRREQLRDDNLSPVIKLLKDKTQPSHADICQYPEESRVLLLSGILCLSRMTFCTGDFTIQTDLRTSCRLFFQLAYGDHTSSGYTPTLVISGKLRPAWLRLVAYTFQDGDLSRS